jgi:D-glycerate 3-kinase
MVPELVLDMHLGNMIEALGARRDRQVIERLAESLPRDGPADWRNLAALLATCERAPVIGICGGQGAGKSTFARLLVRAIQLCGRSAAGCSLDDFYQSRAARAGLAQRVHPLLATRGVPGTHNVGLALETLTALAGESSANIPVFDKGSDDLKPVSEWRVTAGSVSQIVFEGWCLGVKPEPAARLVGPSNELEAREDPDGTWRRYVNDALAGEYQALWGRVDFLVYLQVPDFLAVARWRAQQELQLPEGRRMSETALQRFLAHYQRLTLWMLESLPERADLVVKLDVDHTISGIYRK